MASNHYEVKPVEHVTVGAEGQPGHRAFYLQAVGIGQRVTLAMEKEQVQMLAISIEQFLNDLQQRFPNLPEAEVTFEESEMVLTEPVEPLFRVGNMGLGYDDAEDRLLFVLREQMEAGAPAEVASEASLWCTRSQLRRLARWAVELVRRGRPICGNCGQPIDPEGHFCPRKNGHKH